MQYDKDVKKLIEAYCSYIDFLTGINYENKKEEDFIVKIDKIVEKMNLRENE